jgi:hypothetical protein
MTDPKNLLVELFVEELPPKALKKLGEAFASVLADSLKAQGLARPMPWSRRLRRRAGWRCRWPRGGQGGRQGGAAQADAGGVALDADGQPRPRC